jgi:hypothetical protein
MQINKIILALWALMACNGTITAKNSPNLFINLDPNRGLVLRPSITDVDISGIAEESILALALLSGMVRESNPDTLGLNVYYEEHQLPNDFFGRYAHLYASDCLLASAPAIRCFYFQDNLIVFLGDMNGYIEQIKVFKNFPKCSDVKIDVCHKQYLPAAVYRPTTQDLLSDIEMVKLNSHSAPMAMMKVHNIRDAIILHTYDELEYKDLN